MHYSPTAAAINRLQAARIRLQAIEHAIVSARATGGPSQREDEAEVHQQLVEVEQAIDRLMNTITNSTGATTHACA